MQLLTFLFINAMMLPCIFVLSEETAARLFFHKTISTKPIVEGQDLQVVYSIINNGDSAAFNVEINDKYDPNR